MEFWCVFTLIGLLWAGRQLLDLLLFLWRRNQSLDCYKYGWAVVTGATDGIGKALSAELLARGFRVLLVSRSPAKLQTVKAEFLQRFPAATVETLAVDFKEGLRDPQNFYSDVGRRVEAIGEVSVLVNNVGVMVWRQFEKTSLAELEEMVAVNVLPQTFLTRMLLPAMCERRRKSGQKSLLIDLSSSASALPIPSLAVYGATKSYNSYLSRALSSEVPSGVTVLTVFPAMVATNMPKSNNVPPQPGTVQAEDFARELLKNTAQGSTSGHWVHMCLGWVVRVLLDNPLGAAVVRASARSIEKKVAKTH